MLIPCRAALGAVLAFAVAASAHAADWPQWLGPQRDGVWREDGLLDKFPKGGPKVLWRQKVGLGYSGPAVVGDRVYVTDWKPDKPGRQASPGKERVLCLNAADGTQVWAHAYDTEYSVLGGYPFGPRTTPLIADGKVYTLGAMGDVCCLDAVKGGVNWQISLKKDLKIDPPLWGHSASPLLYGDKLILFGGGKDHAVIALDKKSGKLLWHALSAPDVCYASPIVVKAGGKDQLIAWLDSSLNGLDPDSGKVYWSFPFPADGQPKRPAVSIATPRQVDDLIFVSNYYHGPLVVKLAKDKPEAEVLWRSKSNNPSKPHALHLVMTTPMVKDGYLYGLDGGGEMKCVKAATGEVAWSNGQPTDNSKANFLSAFMVENGDRYFILNDLGELLIAKMTPKGYEQIDKAFVLQPTYDAMGRMALWSFPAFARRCMFARNEEEIICVSLAKEKE
jgi:outer membrane protein assembly factor BamB